MHFCRNLQALQPVQGGELESRKGSRVHLAIRGNVAFENLAVASDIALLRDVNMCGAFFYCRQKPEIGQSAKLSFSLLGQDNLNVVCEGIVRRVEESAPIGVAVEFTHYDLYRESSRELPSEELTYLLHQSDLWAIDNMASA